MSTTGRSSTLPQELSELNLLTLNCWGLLHLSAHRAERLSTIGQTIASADPSPHIVCLQECWTAEDYRAIRRATRAVLPYGKFYYSGAFGGGLVILSRWPIEESTMHRYPLNGRPTAFFRGDWYVGKGVAHARIRYGRNERDVIEVFNTHTHASYNQTPGKDTYIVHRLSQAWELAKLIRSATEKGHLALALGDFNDTPLSLTYRILTHHAPVRDVWRILHPESSLGAADDDLERGRRQAIPTAEYNVIENGATSNNIYNTWRWPRDQQKQLGPGKVWPTIPPDALDPNGRRLDYIFASTGYFEDEGQGWIVRDAHVGMLDRHPDLGCSLSDHFSVEATLVLHRPDASTTSGSKRRPRPKSMATLAPTQEADLRQGVYLSTPTGSEVNLPGQADEAAESASVLEDFDSQLRAAHEPINGLSSSTYDEILTLIAQYMARERFQRRWRGVHFAMWVVVTFVCYIGVWFTPSAVSFVLVLLSSLGLMAGTVDGLMALLFFGGEVRALKEFQWEIMNAKAGALGHGGAGDWRNGEEDKSEW